MTEPTPPCVRAQVREAPLTRAQRGRLGGLANARAKRIREHTPEGRVRLAVALGRFDPGPPTGPHDAWVDAWRKARVRAEINAAVVRATARRVWLDGDLVTGAPS